ncbi:MAG: hypothetical protein CMI18_13650 [Opitutaceae bacterium]|nr:hypothetical protein [Opitutaceae bacterium]
MELLKKSETGKLMARIQISVTGQGIEFSEHPTELNNTSGLTDIFLVARFDKPLINMFSE